MGNDAAADTELSENEYVIMIIGLCAARILQVISPGSVPAGKWSIAGPAMPRELYSHNSKPEYLAEASLIVMQNLDAWLMWAIRRKIAALGYEGTAWSSGSKFFNESLGTSLTLK